MTFRVGQKVVCIRGPGSYPGASWPVKGLVYTVRQINDWPAGAIILLEEINNSRFMQELGNTIEPGFGAKFFRPVTEPKNDAETFVTELISATKTIENAEPELAVCSHDRLPATGENK